MIHLTKVYLAYDKIWGINSLDKRHARATQTLHLEPQKRPVVNLQKNRRIDIMFSVRKDAIVGAKHLPKARGAKRKQADPLVFQTID